MFVFAVHINNVSLNIFHSHQDWFYFSQIIDNKSMFFMLLDLSLTVLTNIVYISNIFVHYFIYWIPWNTSNVIEACKYLHHLVRRLELKLSSNSHLRSFLEPFPAYLAFLNRMIINSIDSGLDLISNFYYVRISLTFIFTVNYSYTIYTIW